MAPLAPDVGLLPYAQRAPQPIANCLSAVDGLAIFTHDSTPIFLFRTLTSDGQGYVAYRYGAYRIAWAISPNEAVWEKMLSGRPNRTINSAQWKFPWSKRSGGANRLNGMLNVRLKWTNNGRMAEPA